MKFRDVEVEKIKRNGETIKDKERERGRQRRFQRKGEAEREIWASTVILPESNSPNAGNQTSSVHHLSLQPDVGSCL